MKELLKIIEKTNDFKESLNLLDSKKNIIIEGTNNLSVKLLWASLLLKKYDRIFWFLGSFQKSQKVKESFTIFLKEKDIVLWEKGEDDISNLNFLHNMMSAKLIILPIEILKSRFPDKKEVENKFKINKKLTINQKDLIHKLVNLGYKRQEKTILEGDFSQRGSIIDIYSIEDNFPTRLEFDENKIEQVFSYNPMSGQKILDLNHVHIYQIKMINKNQDIFSLIAKADLIYWDEARELKDMILEMNQIGLIPQNYKNIEYILSKKSVCIWEQLPGFIKSKNIIQLGWSNVKNYTGRIEKFNEDISNLSRHYSILIDTKKKSNIKKLIKIKNISWKELGLPLGLKSDKEKILIFTDREIIGEVIKEKFKFGEREKVILRTIKPGDLIVHQDYGIGKFRKQVKLKKFGLPRIVYLILEYDNQTYIYLPVKLVSKITPYVGLSKKIKLSKIGSVIWRRIKKKAQESIYRIAFQILENEALRQVNKGYRHKINLAWDKKLDETFEYELTIDQNKALEEIYLDLQDIKSMDRLLCGDVGFGKTEIAERIAAQVVSGGRQVAVLAPTTILVEQHYQTFKNRLKSLPITIERVSRLIHPKYQKAIIKKTNQGIIDILIGTHRILSRDIDFANLGLVIIDEEQQFGVRHKEKFKRLRSQVDILTMTATPIPRTLYLSLADIRKISTIQTPPENRLAINNTISLYDKNIIKKFIIRELERGGQIYFVHNRVETINKAKENIQSIVPKAKIAIAHGRLSEIMLSKVMSDFSVGIIDILVASSIIKNGLDLPNVNTLIIWDATKFGLADLYQLRGRIGRGWNQGYALFLIPKKISRNAQARMSAILENWELGSGYAISRADLETRGGGNILGKDQSGYIQAIGLLLYSQLLSQTIERLKKNKLFQPKIYTIN